MPPLVKGHSTIGTQTYPWRAGAALPLSRAAGPGCLFREQAATPQAPLTDRGLVMYLETVVERGPRNAAVRGTVRDHPRRGLTRLRRPPERSTRMSEPVRITEAEVEQLAALVGLSIDPSDRLAVARQLAGLLTVARLVTEFPLPDEVEGAPVFRA